MVPVFMLLLPAWRVLAASSTSMPHSNFGVANLNKFNRKNALLDLLGLLIPNNIDRVQQQQLRGTGRHDILSFVIC